MIEGDGLSKALVQLKAVAAPMQFELWSFFDWKKIKKLAKIN